MSARDLINYYLSKFQNKYYLEIGIHTGFTFNQIHADLKDSVDPDQAVKAEMKIAIGTTKKMRSATDLRSRFSSWTVIVVSI